MEHLLHKLDIFIDDNSSILILGSFPSVKSREYNFYYSHPQNRFFPTLYSIFDEDISNDIEERKLFLKKHHIALYDVIEECDIVNSDDSSITNVVPIDIVSILTSFPSIRCIALTGNKAKDLFNKYLKDKINNIDIIYLPSSSPRNARIKREDLISSYQIIKSYI